MFIDGKVEYGTGDKKLFEKFFYTSDLLSNTNNSTIAFLHCRKASVGLINEQNAQPVVIKNDNGDIEFVVIHNGTIHNYRELAEKYIPDVDIKDMTDSQVMTRIFYYKGYDVLDEYNGGAVFVIADYRHGTPQVLLFKGASKNYETSKETTEERPLFYSIDKDEQELVFSSIQSNLVVCRCYEDVDSLNPNILYKFKGTKLKPIKNYPRAKCFQSKKTVTQTAYGGSYYQSSLYGDSLYGGSYNSGNTYFSSNSFYITVDIEKNACKYKGNDCDGCLTIGNFGYVYVQPPTTQESHDIWFFNGIPVKTESCYKFLTNLQVRTNMLDAAFYNKYEILIRYLSVDQIFQRNGVWYKATTPISSQLYNGEYQPITSTVIYTIEAGKKIRQHYGSSASNMNKLDKFNGTINFKEIRKECGL